MNPVPNTIANNHSPPSESTLQSGTPEDAPNPNEFDLTSKVKRSLKNQQKSDNKKEKKEPKVTAKIEPLLRRDVTITAITGMIWNHGDSILPGAAGMVSRRGILAK